MFKIKLTWLRFELNNLNWAYKFMIFAFRLASNFLNTFFLTILIFQTNSANLKHQHSENFTVCKRTRTRLCAAEDTQLKLAKKQQILSWSKSATRHGHFRYRKIILKYLVKSCLYMSFDLLYFNNVHHRPFLLVNFTFRCAM